MTTTEPDGSFDEDPQLCPDGACTGTIGANERCTVCGRTGEAGTKAVAVDRSAIEPLLGLPAFVEKISHRESPMERLWFLGNENPFAERPPVRIEKVALGASGAALTGSYCLKILSGSLHRDTAFL